MNKKITLAAIAGAAAMAFAQGAVSASFLWDGAIDTEGKVETGSDEETSGYWYDYNDANDGGSSAFTFPNNLNQSINQVTQSLSSNLAQTRSAEATRQGADSKKEEEMLDQTKDLFQQEQKLIDQAVQLCSTVTQTENQSMRDAIQA